MSIMASPALGDEVAKLFSHDRRVLADPFPLYRRLREEAPAFRHVDRVLITRYADARQVLTAPATLQGLAARGSRYRSAATQLDVERRLELAEMFGFLEKRLGGANGERHTRLRRLAQSAFTPRLVAAMELHIQEITDRLLEPLVGKDAVEVISEFAYHLPLIVVSEMLDIPPDDRDNVRLWANDLGQFVGANWADPAIVSRYHESVFKLRSLLTGVFARRRGGPTTTLLGALLAAVGDGGDRFTEDELVALCTQLVFAGHETTTNFIGNSLILLLGERHDAWEALREDAGRIPNAVEELLRFASPTQYIDKLAAEDCEIAGTEIRQWDTLSVVIGAANRDADVFEDAERLDIGRDNVSHLTFGFGAHHCLGAALARLEARTVLQTLTRRFPSMYLHTSPAGVDWRANDMLRGPERLFVCLGPEAD